MKNILLYLALLMLLSGTQALPISAQTKVDFLKFKGKISPNSENENNDTDPPFKALVFPANSPKKVSNQSNVSDMENGLQIIKDIIDKMIGREYGFTLLPQHKYMINNCLGFKVSAGEFNVKFKNPVFEVGSMGKITIKLGLDKIYLSALKIRMRPCSKPQHIPSPCHFGPKFEIGGEATDVSVTIVFHPVARALAGSSGVCFFALADNVLFKWRIGGLNLKPMQNNLDHLGKDMLEDGLNGGLFNVFYSQFIELSKEVIPEYFEICKGAYDIKEIVDNLPDEVIAGSINSESSGNQNDKWQVKKVNAKTNTGKLIITLPKDVAWDMTIFPAGSDKVLSNTMLKTNFSLLPGSYDLEINHIRITGVKIEKGNETRLKAGTLHITSATSWTLYDETKKTVLINSMSAQKRGLPVGKYKLSIDNQDRDIEIKEGETMEY